MDIPIVDFSASGGSPEGRPRNEYFNTKLDYEGKNLKDIPFENFIGNKTDMTFPMRYMIDD